MKDVIDLPGLREICRSMSPLSASLLVQSLYSDSDNGIVTKENPGRFEALFSGNSVSSIHRRGVNRRSRSIIIFHDVGFGSFNLCGGGMLILPRGIIRQSIFRSALAGRSARDLLDHPALSDPITISSIEAGETTQTLVYFDHSEIEIAKAIEQLKAGKIP